MAHLKELALVQLSGRTLHFLREGETLQLIPLNWCLVILIRYWFGGLALSISLLVSPSALLLSFNTNKYISEVHYSMLYCCCFFNIWTTSELCRCHAWTALHNVANNLFLTMRDSDQSSSFSTSVQCQTHTVDHNVNRVIKIGEAPQWSILLLVLSSSYGTCCHLSLRGIWTSLSDVSVSVKIWIISDHILGLVQARPGPPTRNVSI